MSDLLREIDEELRREHMAALWHKHKYVVMAVLGLLVLGTASYSGWQEHKEKTEVSRSVALGSVGTAPNLDDLQKSEAFMAFAKSNPGTGQAALARMNAVGALIRAGKKDDALRELDALANDPATPALAQSYARLVRVELQFDTGDLVQLRQELAPLAEDGQPWRYTARFLQGTLFGKHGDAKTARDIFTALAVDPNAPVSTRDMAKLLARYYGTQG